MKTAAVIGLIAWGALTGVASAQVRTANFESGSRIVVSDTVKVRASAAGEIAGSQARGSFGVLKGAPVVTNGYTWWNVDYDTGADGWSAEDYMQASTVALVPIPGKVAGVSISHDELIAQLTAQVQALIAQLAALTAASAH